MLKSCMVDSGAVVHASLEEGVLGPALHLHYEGPAVLSPADEVHSCSLAVEKVRPGLAVEVFDDVLDPGLRRQNPS